MIKKFKNLEGVEYSVRFLKPPLHKGKIVEGLCDSPDHRKPQIFIDPNLKTRRKLNVLIEEMFHAHFYEKTEKEARKFSANAGKIIYNVFLRKK